MIDFNKCLTYKIHKNASKTAQIVFTLNLVSLTNISILNTFLKSHICIQTVAPPTNHVQFFFKMKTKTKTNGTCPTPDQFGTFHQNIANEILMCSEILPTLCSKAQILANPNIWTFCPYWSICGIMILYGWSAQKAWQGNTDKNPFGESYAKFKSHNTYPGPVCSVQNTWQCIRDSLDLGVMVTWQQVGITHHYQMHKCSQVAPIFTNKNVVCSHTWTVHFTEILQKTLLSMAKSFSIVCCLCFSMQWWTCFQGMNGNSCITRQCTASLRPAESIAFHKLSVWSGEHNTNSVLKHVTICIVRETERISWAHGGHYVQSLFLIYIKSVTFIIISDDLRRVTRCLIGHFVYNIWNISKNLPLLLDFTFM